MNGLKIAFCCSLRHADAAVRHAEPQDGVTVCLRLGYDGHHHFAVFRELDGVPDEIRDDLAKAVGVAHQGVRHVGTDVIGQFQSLQLCPRRQQLERRGEAVAQVERDDIDGELAGLDLREVEDVVDDGQQRLGGRLDHVQIVALLGSEVRGERELRHANDAVQRRANLVAHVGQEFALRAVGGFCRILRASPFHDLCLEGPVGAGDFFQARSQCIRGALSLGDVGDNPGEADQFTRGVPDLEPPGTNPPDLAVGPHDAILHVQTWCVSREPFIDVQHTLTVLR